MPTGDASFANFEQELNRLVEKFGRNLAELKGPGYDEAKLRLEYLDPFFRALGWDMENRAGLIQTEREVEIESATQIGGGRKRADYLFRTDKRARFVCEAKKPAEELSARYAFQAKRYAWNKGVPVAVLTDFEDLKIYIVGGKPYLDEPQVGEWKSWRFQQYPLIARELWELLGRDRIAAGSIDQALDALPKKATGAGKGKAKQQWLIKPDRTRALDTDFLEFLDETRRDLASDIYKHNDHDELLDGDKLTEACQRVIDRILFLRICEDRDIDTGERLQTIVERWRKNTGNDDPGRRAWQQPLDKLQEAPPAGFGSDGIRAPKDSLWRAIVRHFRALDRRPPTHVPFFNGNLFKPHFTETLVLSDEWLAGFISELSADESPYLFDAIPVEILGSVYERFLGKVVRPHGRGIVVEEKPEVRKAGGVYYTPRYIVDYIVEQTCGKLLDEISGAPVSDPARTDGNTQTPGQRPALRDFEQRTAALRFLDPACGSGSFLIRAFERVCEHWQKRLTADLRAALSALSPSPPSDGGEGRGEEERPAVEPPLSPALSPLVPHGAREPERAAALPSKPVSLAPSDGERARERGRLLAAWQKKHRPLCWVDPATGDVHLTVDLKRRILTQNIYGVDLDAAAVEVTQLSLYLKMLEHENRTTLERERELFSEAVALLPPLQDNIKCFNSLIGSDFSMMADDLVRVKARDWDYEFPVIKKAGGFDAVIGNPPWGADLGRDTRRYLGEQFPTVADFESSQYFLTKSVKLLARHGLLGLIIPNTFALNVYAKKFRDDLLGKIAMLAILDLSEIDVFLGPSVRSVVTILGFSESATCRVLRSPPEFSSSNEIRSLSQEDLRAVETWKEFLVKETPIVRLVSRLAKQFPSLTEYYDVRQGYIPYRTTTLTRRFGKAKAEQIVKNRLWHSDKKLDANYQKELQGADVVRFEVNWSGVWVRYGEWISTYLPISMFSGPRVLIREITGKMPRALMATYTEKVFVHNPSVLAVLPKENSPNPRFITGVLNSRLMSVIFSQVAPKAKKGLFPKIIITDAKRLPIPRLNQNDAKAKLVHDRIVVLVDKLLGLMPKLRAATADSEKATLQNAVTATDQQIDQLVYELYGLTEDEIKLVEGAQ